VPDEHGFDHLGDATVRCIWCTAGGRTWRWPDRARARHARGHERDRRQAAEQSERDRAVVTGATRDPDDAEVTPMGKQGGTKTKSEPLLDPAVYGEQSLERLTAERTTLSNRLAGLGTQLKRQGADPEKRAKVEARIAELRANRDRVNERLREMRGEITSPATATQDAAADAAGDARAAEDDGETKHEPEPAETKHEPEPETTKREPAPEKTKTAAKPKSAAAAGRKSRSSSKTKTSSSRTKSART
jgi:hypothetical protein